MIEDPLDVDENAEDLAHRLEVHRVNNGCYEHSYAVDLFKEAIELGKIIEHTNEVFRRKKVGP